MNQDKITIDLMTYSAANHAINKQEDESQFNPYPMTSQSMQVTIILQDWWIGTRSLSGYWVKLANMAILMDMEMKLNLAQHLNEGQSSPYAMSSKTISCYSYQDYKFAEST